MNRTEHLDWAKSRALLELDPGGGGPTCAIASIHSDFGKHPDLARHNGLELMALLAYGGHLTTAQQVREFVDGLR